MKFDELLAFCKRYPSILCYGASDNGHIVKHFLEHNNIKVTAFVVSNAMASEKKRDGIPIYFVSEINEEILESGIVLSLYEHHHDVVLKLLKSKGVSLDNVYAVKDSYFNEMRLFLYKLDRNQNLLGYREYSDKQRSEFEKKLRLILRKYNAIECRFFNAGWMGEFALWIYHLYKRETEKDEFFRLYYPIIGENHSGREWKGANGYLLSLLKSDGIEVICEESVDFWQYVFKYHRDICRFNDEFYRSGWNEHLIKNCNSIALKRTFVEIPVADAEKGKQIQSKLNLDNDFVCISNRDRAFAHDQRGENLGKDFRDIFRNSDITTYISAVGYLEKEHIKTIRMGAKIEAPFCHPNVTEYASRFRSEFMDVYLTSRCKFFVSNLNGILSFPMLFSKPMVIVDASFLTTHYDAPVFLSPSKDIAIMKKMWDKKDNKFLSLKEILKIEVEICTNSNITIGWSVLGEYQRRGIVPVDNTPEEILAVVKEMNERIDGTVQYDDLDLELQARYREIVDNYPMKENVLNNWRLGAAFLRENQWLLE